MSSQLKEMEKNRELQEQPFPWPVNVKGFSESPRFFYSPEGFDALSRSHFEFELKNIGSSPAVSIDVCGFLITNPEKDGKKQRATSVRIDVLEDKVVYPNEENEKDSFMFTGQDNGLFLNNLIERKVTNLPCFELKIFYRNVLGACFFLTRTYRIYPENDQFEKVKIWLEKLGGFKARYKEEIEKLSNSKAMDDDLFEKLKEKCSEGLTEEEIMFRLWPIPKTCQVSCISLEEYEKGVGSLAYGVFMGDASTFHCGASKENA
jgi:hypothetical protein